MSVCAHIDSIHQTDEHVFTLQMDLENNLHVLEKLLDSEEESHRLKSLELEVAKENCRKQIEDKKA